MISVILPVYNGASYLAEAIQSALNQTLPPDEIIVVDDGSTDPSIEIARGFGAPVTCVAAPHGGAAAARNLGTARARGEWLAFLDADDLWVPEKLQLQMAAVETQPQLEAVLGMMENFISPELDAETRKNLAAPKSTQPGYIPGTVFIRQTALQRIGPLNPALQSGEFIDWWARAREQNLKYTMLPHVLLRRRLHGKNHTLQQRETLQDYVSVARAALERRRKAQ